jgi:hypothetical protein
MLPSGGEPVRLTAMIAGAPAVRSAEVSESCWGSIPPQADAMSAASAM